MKFIHLTDLHLVSPGRYLCGSDPAERLERCLQDIANWHSDADFCVLTGDLAENAEPDAYTWLQDRLKAFPIPCFLMIGNHDVRAIFQKIFADHPQDSAGFVQHTHTTDDGVFIFLDTTKDGVGVDDGQMCPKRLDWLRQQLTAAGDRPCYLFMHHPPFEIAMPYVDNIKLQEVEPFYEALQHGRNIRHIFYGHVHRMTYVNWRGIPFTSLASLNHQNPLIASSVDGVYCNEPPAYGVVLVERDQLTVHFNPFLQREPRHQT